MKQVLAIIRPGNYYKTKEALVEAGFTSMTAKEVLGRGRSSVDFSAKDDSSGRIIGMELIAKKMLEIYAVDKDVDELVQIILKVNSSGSSGDGKIFVSNVGNVMRIRTGQTGEDAIL